MSAISLKSITGITSITTPAGVDNQLTLHNNNTTERVKIDVAGNVHVNNHLSVTGVSTFTGDIDVDGHTNLDNVSIAGVTTFAGNVNSSGNITISNTTPTLTFTDTDANPDFQIKANTGHFYFVDATNNQTRFYVSPDGTTNFEGNLNANRDFSVDGHTNLDNTSIVGIVTISAGTNNEGLRITGQNNNAVIFTSPSINSSAGYRLNHHPVTNVLRVDTTDQNGTYTGIVASFSSAGLDMADNIKLRLGTSQDLTLYHYGNNAYIDNATGSILFRQGGSEKLRIQSDGDVIWNGIGTQLAGEGNNTVGMGFEPRNGTIFLSRADNATILSNRNNDGRHIHFNQGGSNKFAIGLQNSGADLAFFSGAGNSPTERLRITSNGNIGAGNNNPDGFYTHAKNLVVGSGSGGEGITIFSGTSDSGYIGFNDTASNSMQGFIQYNHDGNYMAFGPNGTEKVRIDSGGKLLVNTTSPSISSSELFEVKSSGQGFSHFRNNSSSYATIYIDNEYSDTGFAPFLTFQDGGGNRGGIGQDQNELLRITGQGGISFYAAGTHGSGTERLRIKSDGRIGINANPSVNHEYLHIKPVGNNVLDLRYELNSSTDIRHKYYDDTGTWRGGFNYTTYANSSAYPNFHDSFYFLTDPGSNGSLTAALRITNTGQFIKPLTYQFIVESNGTSVSGGSWSKLSGLSIDVGNSIGISNGTYWSNSNQRFTVPVSGTYNFFFGGWGTYSTSTGDRYAVCFRINGGSFKYISGGAYSVVDSPLNGYAINQNLSVNDYVELWYYSAGSNTWGGGHRVFWGGYFLG